MKYVIFSALLGLGLAGCSSAPQSTAQAKLDERPTAVTQSATPPASTLADSALAPSPARLSSFEASPSTAGPVRSVAYQGEMNLQVDNFEQATSSINQVLDQYGAYPSAAHETRTNDQHYQEMTLKVPAADFLHVVAALARLGQVAAKDIASTDITADLVTLNTRVNARQATAAQYRQLLARATGPAQLRQLQDQSRQLQAGLAADEARLRQLGLGTQGLWATLHLRYAQTLLSPEPGTPLPAFAPQFLASFNAGWSFVLSVLVVLTNVWPLFLLGAVGWPALRWWRRRRPAEY